MSEGCFGHGTATLLNLPHQGIACDLIADVDIASDIGQAGASNISCGACIALTQQRL